MNTFFNNNKEKYLILKIIGFYLLGASFWGFNDIFLPLGFIFIVMNYRPNGNEMLKWIATISGLTTFILKYYVI